MGMNEQRIIEAKLAAEAAGNELDTIFDRIGKAKLNALFITGLGSILGLMAWFDFTFPGNGPELALFIIPFVLAGTAWWLVSTLYLRSECVRATQAYGEAVKLSCVVEQEELGNR